MDDLGDGGPAFPVHGHEGMSLRDWFAGMYMQGFIAWSDHNPKASDADVAQWAYEQADAMLKARRRG